MLKNICFKGVHEDQQLVGFSTIREGAGLDKYAWRA